MELSTLFLCLEGGFDIKADALFCEYFKQCAQSGHIVNRSYIAKIFDSLGDYSDDDIPEVVGEYIAAYCDFKDDVGISAYDLCWAFTACTKHYKINDYDKDAVMADALEFKRVYKIFCDHLSELYRTCGDDEEEFAGRADVEHDNCVLIWPRYFY